MYGLRHGAFVNIPLASASRNLLLVAWMLVAFAHGLLSGTAVLRAEDMANAERLWQEGSKAYSDQDWSKAATSLRELCERHESSPRAALGCFYLGESLLQSKQPEQARAYYDRFLEKKPRHQFAKQAQFRSGECAYLSGDHEVAGKRLQAFLVEYPKDSLAGFATVYLGEMEMAAGRHDAALTWFTRANEQFPQGPLVADCRFGAARAHEERKHFGEAEAIYRELAADEQCARRAEAEFRLGVVEYSLARYADAASAFEQHAIREPDSPHLVEARYWQARSEAAQSHWTETIRILEETVSTAASHRLAPAIHFSLAEAYRHVGSLEDARKHYGQVVESWPNSAWGDDSLEVQIAIAVETNDHELAERLAHDFQSRYPLSPLRARVDQWSARSFLAQRKFAEARELLAPMVDTASGTLTAEQRWWNQYYLARAEYGLEHLDATENRLGELARTLHDDQQRTALSILEFHYWQHRRDFSRLSGLLGQHLELAADRSDRVRLKAQIALCQAQQGSWSDVRESLKQLEQDLPLTQSAAASLEVLITAARQSQEEELAKLVSNVLVDHAPSPDAALMVAARGCYEHQQLHDAKALIERLLREHEHSSRRPDAIMLLGQIYSAEGRHAAAAEEFRRLADEHAGSDQVPVAMLGLARTYRTQRDNVQAKRVYERILAEFPSHRQRDEAMYQLGWILQESGDLSASQAMFARVIDEMPASRYRNDARYRLAEQAYRAHDWERLDVTLEPLFDPDIQEPLRGHVLQMAMLSQAAREKWDQVEQFSGELRGHADAELSLPARYWFAESLYRRGRYRESVSEWHALAKVLIAKNHALRGATLLREAQSLAQLRRWDEVYPALNQLDATMPEFRRRYEADYLRGRCLFEQGQYAESRKYLEQVVLSAVGGRSESAAISQWLIGESLMRQREYPAAIAAFQRVQLYDYPTWKSAALLQEGKCCELSGEKSQGIQRYARLLRDAPESNYAQEASRRMNAAQAKTPVRK